MVRCYGSLARLFYVLKAIRMATRKISGLRIILTGVSSGIGRALALQLARRGAKLILNARREDRLEELRKEIQATGQEAFTVAGDVTDPQVRERLLAAAKEHYDGLDCLINNAGVGGIGKFAESDEARLRRIMEVNFFAPLALIRLTLPELRKGKTPLIVNVASVLGHCAIPKKSEYCASKFAIHGFSDSLRSELAEEKIDVMILSPSTTQTEFFDVAYGEDKRQLHWLSGGGQSPTAVAQAAVRAMEKGKYELILTSGGKIMVWLDRLFPWFTAQLIRKYGQ